MRFTPDVIVIGAALNGLAAALALGGDRTRRPLDAGTLAKVLLRLYEQSEDDRPLRRRCLDAWDRLLAERIGLDVPKHLDA